MRIVIVGCGNSGTAHAAVLSLAGHTVHMLRTSSYSALNADAIRRQGGIFLYDSDGSRSFCPIALVTTDPRVAFEGAEILFVLTQTSYHRIIADRLSPFLRNLRAIFVVPGYMGTLCFLRSLGDSTPIVAEGESTVVDARLAAPGSVNILFRNVRNALGFLPASKTAEGLLLAKELFPTYGYSRRHIIESALHNPNLIVHTVGAIMSSPRIEYTLGEYWMYREVFTNSVWNLVEALDEEKMRILDAACCERLPYLDACRFRNEVDMSCDPKEVFRKYAESGSPKGPQSLRSRYLTEDVPMGLGMMKALGTLFRVETPICNSLIQISSALLKEDFGLLERNLVWLGVECKDGEALVRWVSGDTPPHYTREGIAGR